MKKAVIMNPKFFILTLSSAWMIGTGLRMIIGIYCGMIYVGNSFDIFFDWTILLLLGIMLLLYSLHSFWKISNRKGSHEVEKH